MGAEHSSPLSDGLDGQSLLCRTSPSPRVYELCEHQDPHEDPKRLLFRRLLWSGSSVYAAEMNYRLEFPQSHLPCSAEGAWQRVLGNSEEPEAT